MASVYIESLSRDVRRKIKEQAYSEPELARIHSIVKEQHKNKQKGLRRAACMVVCIVAVMFVMTVIGGPDMPREVIAMEAALMGGVVLLTLGLSWYVANKMTLQFISALKQGYPELEEKYGSASFKNQGGAINGHTSRL